MKAEKPAPNGASFSEKSNGSRPPEVDESLGVPQGGIANFCPAGRPRAVSLQTINEGAGETKASLRDVLITADKLVARMLLPRPKILGEWMREGDLGYVFAPRGHGKTWLTMLIGNAVAECCPLGAWTKGENSRRVVYFDAEMNLPDVQARAKLIGISSANFVWLQNELVFDHLRRGLNIAEVEDQAAISEMLDEGDVFIIDNLSTAASGMAENDNDAFDAVKGWLLELRGRKITVLIVHHAGRNGEMRGASRREDMAHWILSLKDDSGDGEVKAWVTIFKKCRNCQAMEAPPLRWTIATKDERLEFTCEKHSGPEAMYALISEGVERAGELADELGVTTGCVSKWAKKLAAAGRIKIGERKYTLP
jgi:AAA domain